MQVRLAHDRCLAGLAEKYDLSTVRNPVSSAHISYSYLAVTVNSCYDEAIKTFLNMTFQKSSQK